MRRLRLKKGAGYESARKLITQWRDKERMTFDRMAEILECNRLEAITIYVQERTKTDDLLRQKIARHDLKLPKPAKQDKYSYLIDEPINQGCSYAEYMRRREVKLKPLRRARLAVLKEERKRRIAIKGKLDVPRNRSVEATLKSMHVKSYDLV